MFNPRKAFVHTSLRFLDLLIYASSAQKGIMASGEGIAKEDAAREKQEERTKYFAFLFPHLSLAVSSLLAVSSSTIVITF